AEVGGGVLQGAARVVRQVPEGLVVGQAVPLDVARGARLDRGRAVDHRLERARRVEVGRPERVHAGDDRVVRVAGHHAFEVVVLRPPVPHVVRLVCLVVYGLRDVTGLVRGEQREQLRLGAVDVPAGEVRVLGVPLGGLVDLPVEADVPAVDVG